MDFRWRGASYACKSLQTLKKPFIEKNMVAVARKGEL